MATRHEFDIVRHPRARRTRLSIDPASGRLRLTLPARVSDAAGLRWAEQQREWIEAQRARLPQARPFAPGATVGFDDVALVIDWSEQGPRRTERVGERLMVGGPRDGLGRRVTSWLKREALTILSAETAYYARAAGVSVSQVAVGDARGRWGSCSWSGAIRYNWRLVMAPSWVRRATVAHEVAHRVHMNHGPAFHALVARLYGADPTPARNWLRREGATLHWLGRDS